MSRAFAWLIVGLRAVIPVAWAVVAVLVTVTLPALGTAGSAPLDDLVSQGGGAAAAQQRATERFGFPLYTDTVVVAHDRRGLPDGAQERQLRAADAVRQRRAHDLPGLRAVLPISNDPGSASATTALSYLFFADEANLEERRSVANRYAQRYLGGREGAVAGVTGAAPARLAQFEEIQDALPFVEAGSVALIFLIVGLAFRSVGAPLVTLVAAGVAYLIAIRVLPWVGERTGASVPAEVEPIIVVLLLGLVTDYAVFYESETRRRLRLGENRLDAVRAATARTAPIVFTAGLIVAAGTASLAVGELGFFRAFGPGLALTTLIALAVSMTLIPALLALFGSRLFGRDLRWSGAAAGPVPQEAPDTAEIERVRRRVHADHPSPSGRESRWRLALTRPLTAIARTRRLAELAQTSRWRIVIARVASARPVALVIAVVCLAALGALAVNAAGIRLGLGFVKALPAGNEVRSAADAAEDGFAPGALSPTEIGLEQPGIATRAAALAQFEDRLRREPGVAAVLGSREQPPPPAPAVFVTRDGGAARFAVIFGSDPTGATAIERLDRLRGRLPALLRASGLPGARVYVGGETVVGKETVDGVTSDLKRIGAVALVVNLLLLMLFLRAVIAPLYLVLASVLGLGATLGITALVFQGVLGHDDVTYYVPFAAAVLLVALGSDYNVFVAGRIREEARWMRLREAIAVATPAAAKAVTVAGLALAASFALLVVVPLRSFHEFAFVMAVGVLLDTFLVRSLLVPALTALFGELAWWPGRRLRPVSASEIAARVGDRTRLRPAEAEALTEGTLAALADRITPRERRVLAEHLPPHLGAVLAGGGEHAERFPVDEFLLRARERAGGRDISPDEMHDYAAAVLTTLEEAAPDDLAYVRAQLSDDYDPLFKTRAEAAPADLNRARG